ncbi:transposase, partial [Acinetobacter baumannii]|uniref:transposase n=1 Tax=Acinetobacter baumannii TaxID=470 RepID=UPI00280F9F9C
FRCRLIHLKIILWNKPLEIGLCNKAVPIQKQSGTSVRGATRISKSGSSRIRAALYMAAIVAIRFNPHSKVLYNRLLKNGKSKMSALCAVMRKLVYLCYGVLKNKTPYQPDYA